jgi:hypothetical protein
MPKTKSTKDKKTADAPSTLPPDIQGSARAGTADAPTLPIEEITRLRGVTVQGIPALAPPSEAVQEAAMEAGIAAWHNAVTVTALWCSGSPRNAWAAIQGLGWRRVTSANDSAFTTITGMLSHARQLNAPCNVRIESDNEIHEVYVW